ncbi:hypothetical protein E6O75_ATG07252 [Venturia nashicola]|uniref:Uncharacterized protein n=1 Tax=Venturia nashicola TaxID=86259 RepID=A0A4Z1NJN3_9PEZI|nr:hypothetical protein E6O75_ATG07252 [Venturia nashicola]
MGGPEPNKYQKREERRKEAEQSNGRSGGRDATLQKLPSVRDSQNQRSSQLGSGSDHVIRGNLQHLGSQQSGYGFGGYGPGGPRSESGSSMTSSSSIFGGGGSIGGQFDGPKDSRPSDVNVGNLELGARIWFTTRSSSIYIHTSVHITSASSQSLRDGESRSLTHRSGSSQDAADQVLAVSIRLDFP